MGKSGENGRIDIGQQCNIFTADQKRETRKGAAASAFSANYRRYKILLYPYNFLLCGNAIDPIPHKFSLCWYNDLLYPIRCNLPGPSRPPSRFVHDAQFSNGPAAPAPPKVRTRGTREGHGDPAGAIFDNFPRFVQNVKKVQTRTPTISGAVFRMSKNCASAPPIIFDSLFKMSKKCSPEILNTFPPTAQKHPSKNFEHFSGKGQKRPSRNIEQNPPESRKKPPSTPP